MLLFCFECLAESAEPLFVHQVVELAALHVNLRLVLKDVFHHGEHFVLEEEELSEVVEQLVEELDESLQVHEETVHVLENQKQRNHVQVLFRGDGRQRERVSLFFHRQNQSHVFLQIETQVRTANLH